MYLHHEKHIIHRDLKPSNILINHWGEVKICDFGVSGIINGLCAKRDSFTGTYNYMAVGKSFYVIKCVTEFGMKYYPFFLFIIGPKEISVLDSQKESVGRNMII